MKRSSCCVLVLMLMLSVTGLWAEDREPAEAAESVTETASPAPAGTDDFVPTEQLRFDQEVDFPVDI